MDELANVQLPLGFPAQDQPFEATAPSEDPPPELQRSFFEVPGFMKTPERGGP